MSKAASISALISKPGLTGIDGFSHLFEDSYCRRRPFAVSISLLGGPMPRRLFAPYLLLFVLNTAILGQDVTPPKSKLTETAAPAPTANASPTAPATAAPVSAPPTSPATPAAITRSSDAANPAAPAAPVARPPRFVPVLISATDSHGSPVLGLTKEQLTILDTNQPVDALRLYKGSDLPLHLGIVLVCAPRTFSQQQAAAIDLVNKVIRPGVDEAFVVTARCKKPWPSERLEWKQDPAELGKIISGLDQNSGLVDAFNFDLETTDVGLNRSNLQTFAGGGVTVFDVAYSMMSSDPRPSRRVLFMFREPWAHSPGFGERGNAVVEGQLLRVIAAAQQMHVSTFVIGLEDQQFNRSTDTNIGKDYSPTFAGQGAATRTYDERLKDARVRAYEAGRTNISRLATETGGAVFWSTKKNFSDAVAALANVFAGQYIVTFVPKDTPAQVHPLKVTTKEGTHILSQAAFSTAAP